MKGKIFSLILIIVVVIMACNPKDEFINGYNLQSIDRLTNLDWEKLAQAKIYFGHQSVGFNIIEGIGDILSKNKPNILTIDESLSRLQSSQPVFAHTRIGRNREPILKIDDFSDKIKEIDGKVDIAFLKLCYVDISKTTNIIDLFNHYKKTLAVLKETYPEVTFIHFTVPLTSDEKGFKTSIKKLLGKFVQGYENNIAKYQYNEMLRAEYDGKEPLFDIAAIESTNQDGRQAIYTLDNKQYTATVNDYTYDGGHLNELGRKVIAEQLLIYLVNLIK